ncbi:MAG: alpha/beta fold hydrolase [Candidatus Uhrbacteria bacterium]|nr:alpha/beta fold hydrolase [Candidatus Uhrbacteria bacterium]
MKRALIIHCWGGYPEYCWYPWAKQELEKQGIEVVVPAFPNTDTPQLNLWLPELEKVIGRPDEDTFLIGHSIGCALIMRYLESLADDEKVRGAVFVAGFIGDLGFPEIKNFFETPLDFEKIKKKCPKFVAIQSDNDPYVPVPQADMLKEKLGVHVIMKHNFAHFSGAVDNEASCVELPDVVDAVVEMSK